MSPQELADYLAIPVQTVYGWTRTRSGPVRLKIGRHVRYRRRDVEDWLILQQVEVSAAKL